MNAEKGQSKDLAEVLRGMLVLLEMQEQLVLEALTQAGVPGAAKRSKKNAAKTRKTRSTPRRKKSTPAS